MTISADLKHTGQVVLTNEQFKKLGSLMKERTKILPGQQPSALLTVAIVRQLKNLGWSDSEIKEFDQGEVNSILKTNIPRLIGDCPGPGNKTGKEGCTDSLIVVA